MTDAAGRDAAYRRSKRALRQAEWRARAERRLARHPEPGVQAAARDLAARLRCR